MANASHLINHSKKLRNLMRHEHTSLVRWFSIDAHCSIRKRGDALKGQHHVAAGKARFSSTATSENLSFIGKFEKNMSRKLMKVHRPIARPLFLTNFSGSQAPLRRGFSSDSGLPPHQEIGMPSLSPTMMEGNIARWLKKEGDKVNPGEVLCEVETDKATVEMECMEEGYLAKIIKGDGSKEIKVGEVIAITVEDEEDIGKFKDYSPSASQSEAADLKGPSPPKDEKVEKPVSSSEPKISKTSLPPHQEIGMPSLSPTMTEGNIARWLKKEGDKVTPGEVLCEVETDKATVEMECMEEGYIAKIIKDDGSKEIKVGELIAITVEDEEDIGKFKDYSPSASQSGAADLKGPSPSTPPKEEKVEKPVSSSEPKISKPSTAPGEDRVFASPLARQLAEEHNLPLSSIKGTGPEGHIVKADIEDFLASRGKEVSAKAQPKDSTVATLDYVDIPHTQIRKVTAQRLLFSKQTIPHYYLTVDACVDNLMGLRSQLNSIQEASGGKRISVNDLVIKAAALALRKVPQCNSSWTDNYIRQYNNININVAVQTDNGLYVPVVRDADKKGLSQIAGDVKQLAQKAKDNILKPEDYEGGTFTVSNLGGPFGIKEFCAIINPPQSGILAVGSAEKRVVPGSAPGEFKFASFMPVTLSCDHRVIDGAIGAEWLKAFKGYIENPETMLL